MKKRRSLNQTWYGLVILITILPMIIMISWIGFSAHSLLLNDAIQKEKKLNNEIKSNINLEFNRIITMLQNKSDPMAFTLTRTLNEDLIEKLFEAVLSREKAINSLSLISRENRIILSMDRDGTILNGTGINKKYLGNKSKHPKYEHLVFTKPPEIVIPLHGRTYVSSPTVKDNIAGFRIGIPVGPLSHPVAVLVASVNTGILWNNIKPILLYPEVSTYLVDSHGRLLLSPPSIGLQAGKLVTHMNIVRTLIANKEWDITESYTGLSGKDVFGIASYIDTLNWGVISEISRKKITGPIYTTILSVTGVIILIALLSGVIGLLFVSRLLKPFALLGKAFDRVSNGDYTTRIGPSSVKEIDNIVEGFNRMTQEINQVEGNLKELNESLEERVIERTADVAKLSHAIEYSSAMVMITDIEGNIEYTNPKFTQVTGYSLEEVKEKNPRVLQSGKTPPELYEELWETITSGNEWRGEFCNKNKNGQIYWEVASISPVKNDKGVIRNFIAIKDDCTEQKNMEEMLLQSEKLKSMGTITAGVAHEFNNILAVMVGSAELLEGGFKDDKELKKMLHDIIKAGDDGAEIVRNMLKFAKSEGKDKSDYIFFDIKHLINDALDFAAHRWRNMAQARGIDYKIDKEGMREIPDVLCNTTELREVFTNIINNALDAMPEGGTLSFSTWSDDDNVFISVSDTGKGMPEEVKRKIFDPFFTTRRPLGTGLGMSVSYSIITRHGGRIEVESEVGKGATFNLSIPIGKDSIQKTVPSEPVFQVTTRKLHVLVVDDCDEMCVIMGNLFTRYGHTVKTVNNGADAIEFTGKEDFDLVLCDLAMPDVYGYEVIKAINNSDKMPKIGIMTGWDEKLKPVDDEEFKVDFILKKPFKHAELIEHINELFGAGS